MSKKDKDSMSFDEQREKEAQEAKKKLKQAEKSKPGKDKKEKKSKGSGRKARRWLRDFRGELKKIVWPDFKTVVKNTGIVLMMVIIIGSMVWIVDFLLSRGIGELRRGAESIARPPIVDDIGEIPEPTLPIEIPTTDDAEAEEQEEEAEEAESEEDEDEEEEETTEEE